MASRVCLLDIQLTSTEAKIRFASRRGDRETMPERKARMPTISRPPHVHIYIHSSGAGNLGPGSWGVFLSCEGREKEIGGNEAETTGNRMGLTAAIRALEALTHSSRVTIYTDSSYVRDGITKWLDRWKRNGWRTSDRKAVKNVDLWRRLAVATRRHQIEWRSKADTKEANGSQDRHSTLNEDRSSSSTRDDVPLSGNLTAGRRG